MMRWLARLLHPKRKNPGRPEARVFLAHPDPVMSVLTETADVITGTLKEVRRQHRQSLQTYRAPPPLPAPRPTPDKDVSLTTPRPPPKPTSRRQRPPPTPAPASGAHSTDAAILTNLKRASTAKQRRAAALKHPELRPPHDALNPRENTLLELTYWQGLTYKDAAMRFGFSPDWASQVCNKALRKLTYHVQRGGRLGTASQGPPDPRHDPRLGDFARAHSAMERLRVSRRYPELKPPHAFLTNRENVVLEWTYWQGRSDEDHATPFFLTQKELRAVRNRAFRKLNDHYQHHQPRQAFQHAPPHQPEADGRLAELKRPSPVTSGEDAPITALLQAGPAEKRRKVAERYPELRPPHPCLTRDQNELLEMAFWQARTYREIAELKSLARREVGTRIRKALRKLNQHLHGDAHGDEDRLGEVLLALNECGSVRRAAKKLKLPKDVLKVIMEREGIKARFVFEVEP